MFDQDKPLKVLGIFFIVVFGFIFSFAKHLTVVYYFLSIIIFLFYLPQIYASSRISIKKKWSVLEKYSCSSGFCKLPVYPIEFYTWLGMSMFFTYLLAHLLADRFDGLDETVNIMIFPFLFVCMLLVVVWELYIHKVDDKLQKRNAYILQGRVINFIILLIFTLIFFFGH